MSKWTQDPNKNYLLEAKIDNVKNLSVLLKCVHFRKTASCFASYDGLKIVVQDSKCVQIAAFIEKDFFQKYNLCKDHIGFGVELKTLIECLTIFDTPGSSTALHIYYKGYGFPLRLHLIEDDFMTVCIIQTLEVEELLKFSLPEESVCNKFIADATQFKELFTDLDPGTDNVEIYMSPDPPYFKITTCSSEGICQISLPKNADMMENFSCTLTATTSYKYSQIKPLIRLLQITNKVILLTDDIGLLYIQFMVKTEGRELICIEYFCRPLICFDEEEKINDNQNINNQNVGIFGSLLAE